MAAGLFSAIRMTTGMCLSAFLGEKMKKLLVLLLALGLCSSACGKKTEEAATGDAPKAEAAAAQGVATAEAVALLKGAETTKDGLIAMCQKDGDDSVSATEFEALLLAFADCKPVDVHLQKGVFHLASCAASDAWNELRKNKKIDEKDQAMQDILMRLTKHDNIVVRHEAYEYIDVNKMSDDTKKTLIKNVSEDKDPVVTVNMISKFLHSSGKLDNKPEVKDFALAMAKESSSFKRSAVAGSIDSKNKDDKAFNDLILSLCKEDAEENVREVACGRIVEFDIPDKMKIAEDLLKDRSLVGTHDRLLMNLCRMWDPTDKIYDAEAYRLWLDYFKFKPRTDNMAWRPFSNAFKVTDEWRQKATYFDEKDFLDTMTDLANDTDAMNFARANGVKMIALFGGKEKGLPILQAIQKKNENDPKYKGIKNDLEKKIAELSK